MKKILMFTLLLMASSIVFGQTISKSVKKKADTYLQKLDDLVELDATQEIKALEIFSKGFQKIEDLKTAANGNRTATANLNNDLEAERKKMKDRLYGILKKKQQTIFSTWLSEQEGNASQGNR